MILQVGHISFHLAKLIQIIILQYFINLGFPEIAGVPFPLLKSPPFGACEVGDHIIDPQVVDRHLLFSNFGPDRTIPFRTAKGRSVEETRLCVCGSALFFGSTPEPVTVTTRINTFTVLNPYQHIQRGAN